MINKNYLIFLLVFYTMLIGFNFSCSSSPTPNTPPQPVNVNINYTASYPYASLTAGNNGAFLPWQATAANYSGPLWTGITPGTYTVILQYLANIYTPESINNTMTFTSGNNTITLIGTSNSYSNGCSYAYCTNYTISLSH